MQKLQEASDSFSMTSVEQTAYFRAMGEKQNLNLNKHRDQVEKELKARRAKENKGNDN